MASIKKRGESAYEITVSLGYGPDGKKIIRTKTVKPDPSMTPRQQEKEAARLAVVFEEEVKRGGGDSGATFAEHAARWLREHAEPNLEPKTVSVYRHLLESKILPAIGHVRLSKLAPAHLSAFYRQLAEDGARADGKPGGYSTRTIKYCHGTVSTILSAAVQWGALEANPALKVRPPKGAAMAKKTNHFDDAQAAKFLAHIESEPIEWRALVHLALFGGLRLEEVLPLEWADIDLERRTVDINKTITYVDGLQIVKGTAKNKGSIRRITIPRSVAGLLAEYRGGAAAGRLFKFHYSSPRHWLRKSIRKYNAAHEDKLPDISFHGLRHTNATLLISQGVDIRTVSGRLGHNNPGTTLAVYSHFIKSRDEAASDALEGLLGKK